MRRFAVTVDIAAPLERVWEVMSDVDRWHEWTASIRGVTRVDGRPLEVGTRVLIRQPGFPVARWTVTRLVPGESFAWTSNAPGLTVEGSHAVVPGEDGGSIATLAIEIDGFFGGLWEFLTGAVTRKFVTMEAQGLKARSENPSYDVGSP